MSEDRHAGASPDENEYEVVEIAEGEDGEDRRARDDDDGEGEGGDARLHADADEESDSRRESRRKRRQEQKERRKQFRDADRQTIDELRRQNEIMAQQMGMITGKMAQGESQQIDAAMRQAQIDFQRAEHAHAEAIRTGNGQQAAQALRARDEASNRYHQTEAAKRQLVQQVQQQQIQRQQPTVDPRVQDHAKDFMRRNPWYSPANPDQDTEIVNAIDNTLTREGYAPNSEEYWDELEDRVREQLPHRFRKAGRRGSPPVGGGRDTGRETSSKVVQVRVTPERKAALIAADKWDDPVKRKEALRYYADFDRQNRSGR